MTYADMITLLLCFFIIFVSVSEPKKDKLSEIAEGVKGKFGAVDYHTPFIGAIRALQTTVESNKLYRDVAITPTPLGLNMELATRHFFKEGTAEFDESALADLNEIANSLKKTDMTSYHAMTIESHTDDTAPISGLYKNNWELSSLRAAKLADFFIKQGFSPDKIKAVGYADSRPKVPNLDVKGNPIPENRAQNQRVLMKME